MRNRYFNFPLMVISIVFLLIFGLVSNFIETQDNNDPKPQNAPNVTSTPQPTQEPTPLPTVKPTPKPVVLHGPYEIVRVSDGDTIVVSIDGEDERIRLIGIDTPESVHPDKEKNTPEGEIASEWVKSLLEDKSVYLEYDVEEKDYYDRVLAYVYIDETTMLQKELLNNGLATVYTVQPNSKYSDEFYELQKTARENKVGFWETEFFTEEQE